MASSLAKECLSPALKNSSMRRRSLEICQQLGGQLLSPTFLRQFTDSSQHTPCPSSSSTTASLKASPICNSTKNSTPSPFKLLDNSKPLLSPQSPVFSFAPGDNSEQEDVPNLATYRSKRRASDSFWIERKLVENFQQKLATFQKDEVKVGKQRRTLTPAKQRASSSTLSENNQESNQEKETCEEEEESTEKAGDKSGESKHAQRCTCSDDVDATGNDDDDAGENEQAADSNREAGGTSVVTCHIIPPTPLKKVETKSTSKESMPPLQRSQLTYSSSSSSDSENGDDEGETNDTLKSDRIRTRTCSFQLDQQFVPVKSSRRCSGGAKYDLDDNLIKLVALHWNLSLDPNELLGKGSFGTVIAGQYQGKPVAVKVLKITNAQKKASIAGEDNARNLPFHNHIARTLDIFQLGPNRTLIIMEKMHKGNLFTLLNDPSFPINCSTAINISKQIALGLIFCHRQGILHLDVKPQNILVDYSNCCKLSDFGSSKKISDLTDCYKSSQLEGTVPYTAPELFQGARPTEKCDVYSFAITMWQILNRENPYEDENEHTVIFRVVSQGLRPGNNNEPTSPNPDEKKLQDNYVQLYKGAWNGDPETRPTMIDMHKNLIKIQFLP